VRLAIVTGIRSDRKQKSEHLLYISKVSLLISGIIGEAAAPRQRRSRARTSVRDATSTLAPYRRVPLKARRWISLLLVVPDLRRNIPARCCKRRYLEAKSNSALVESSQEDNGVEREVEIFAWEGEM
jgi:hypothetical protein